MTLPLLERHRRVAIDSNVLIYLLEGSGPMADAAARLLDAIADGAAEGVLSALALAEICRGPAMADEPALVERYADELQSLDNVRVVSLTPDVAVDAAVIGAASSISLADAVHLASARHAGASVLVTNDHRIRPTSRLDVAYLDTI